MIKCLILILSATFFAPGFALAASSAQEKRFTQWLDALERPLASSDKKKDAAQALMADEEARTAAFNLQGLGRVYKDLDEGFEKIQKGAKDLEDALGAVDKWNSLKNKSKLAEAEAALADLLKNKEWMGDGSSPRIQKFRGFLNDFRWPSDAHDRDFVANKLAKQLERVNETQFDMGTLEEGNGLHELRRQLRWFLIEAKSVDGLIQFKTGRNCPIADFAGLKTEDISKKYSKLSNTRLDVGPCRISQCLFYGVADLVKKIGDVKDEAEHQVGNSRSDKVPAELRRQAERIYKAMTATGLVPELIKEVKACEG